MFSCGSTSIDWKHSSGIKVSGQYLITDSFIIWYSSLSLGCLQKLIIICLSGGDERDPSETAVRASAGAILARLLVMNSNYLAHLTAESSLSLALQQAGISIDQNIILCLADLWLEKVTMQQPEPQYWYFWSVFFHISLFSLNDV